MKEIKFSVGDLIDVHIGNYHLGMIIKIEDNDLIVNVPGLDKCYYIHPDNFQRIKDEILSKKRRYFSVKKTK